MAGTRLFEILDEQLRLRPLDGCIASKEGGSWRSLSTQQVYDMAERAALGLMALGVRPGDRVAMASGNRSEWCVIDQAILRIGAINIPLYPTSSDQDFAYILHHCGARVFFCSNAEIHAKAAKAKQSVPALEHLFTFERTPDLRHWSEVLEMADASQKATLDAYKQQVRSEQLATIIYTSGTTGKPKGVMLSHDNIMSNVEASAARLPITVGAKAFSFLPLCHIYERMLMYLYMHTGISIHFQETFDDLGDRIREVQPHVFTAVPRLLEKIYARIMAKGEELTGIKRTLFFWAVGVGERYDVHGKSAFYRMELALARKLIFSKWQAALGGQVRCVASGSAALQPRLARIFNAAGIPLMEGYGLTETSPVVSVNDARNDGLRFGSVGKPLSNVQVRIAEDGEILVKGPNVMIGYYNEPELTAQVLTPDGWFHTGDIGEITAEGFLRITDRKKEIFKTSGGKYIAPQMIENMIKSSPLVEQVMVIGENRKFPAALIVPNFEALESRCQREGIALPKDRQQIIADAQANKLFNAHLEQINAQLGQWEQVKKFALLPAELTIANGELTPSLKLKRKAILEKHASVVEGLYRED